MIEFNINYNGKPYKRLEDAAMAAAVDGVKEYFAEKLKPFEAELKEHGAEVNLDIPKGIDGGKLRIEDIPDDLKERIERAVGAE